MSPTLATDLADRLAAQEAQGQRRVLRPLERREGAYLWREGRRLLDFSSNDYLDLARHPAVIEAAARALRDHGASACASRLVSGEHPLYAPLESALAAHHGQEAALVFSSGYAANLGLLAALMGEGDLILADKFAHACLLDGARLSGAMLKRFAHHDAVHARALLETHRPAHRRALLVTEQIFSMDGDAAPLADLAELARAQDAWLLIDAAHALAPLPALPNLPGLMITGTLSKTFGSLGGYVAGSRTLIDFLIGHARSFIFSTGLPPASTAAAHAAMLLSEAEPERAARAQAHAQRLAALLDLPAPAIGSSILPIPVGEEKAALRFSGLLEARGFAVPAIRPPTVPPGTARLRASCTAQHSEKDIHALAQAILQTRRSHVA